jgi:hypothetical protein
MNTDERGLKKLLSEIRVYPRLSAANKLLSAWIS